MHFKYCLEVQCVFSVLRKISVIVLGFEFNMLWISKLQLVHMAFVLFTYAF